MTGIYKIFCEQSEHSYVGSAINIKDRWRRHKKDLRKQKHHSIILQRAFNKYGEDKFVFSILEECSIEQLISREQYYLDLLQPIYNIVPNAGNNRGRIEREETKIKRREFAKMYNIRPPKETWEKKQKAVIMLHPETKEELRTFDSLSEACRFVGKNHTFVSCITRAIKLHTKSYNYFWKWK